MLQVKLIAVDLDGTLLRSDHTVSDNTVETLRRGTAAGITVLLATARPLRSVRPVAAQLGHTGLALCSDGAVVYDFHTDTIVDVHPLDAAVVNAVTDAIRHAVPDVAFAVERVTSGFGQEPHYPTHVDDTGWGANLPIAPIGELITDDAIKLLVETRSMTTEQLLAADHAVPANDEDGIAATIAKLMGHHRA